MDKFNVFLCKSEKMRTGYMKSLELADANFEKKWLEHFTHIPIFFKEIYNVCNGTRKEISEQVFFDFLPGYRLMQIDEIIDTYEQNFKTWSQYDDIIPFLTDYSGCYYAYTINNDKECIVMILDGVVERVHSKISDFWDTIIAFYDEGVYFLDEDGYLSYDFEKEGEVGKKYNKDIDYWGQ